ncbi:MAG: sulfur carrier protein ThiS [Eubacterium sp.]|nr:sulfur carrier protein ThiS [Eubacterium sp.]
MVKINGTESKTAGQTILTYLTAHAYDPSRVAVERNGSIVPKALYHTTVLADGDVLEIVRFVGGG